VSIREESGDVTIAGEHGGAALWRRATGRLVDVALWGVFVVGVAMFSGSDAEGAMIYPVWFYFVLAFVPIVYEAGFACWSHGQTLGKRWAGTQVAAFSGGTPGLLSAVIRAAVTWPFLVIATDDQLGPWLQIPAIVIYVAIFASVLTNQSRRGLHDVLAGTIVLPAAH